MQEKEIYVTSDGILQRYEMVLGAHFMCKVLVLLL